MKIAVVLIFAVVVVVASCFAIDQVRRQERTKPVVVDTRRRK